MIIGLTGKMHCGRDHVCKAAEEFLESLNFVAVKRMAFADKLKKSLAATLGITVEQLEAAKDVGTIAVHLAPNVHRILTIRELLQRYGTEGHRKIWDDDFWIQSLWSERLFGLGGEIGKSLFFITDVRFDNEAGWVREMGGIVVRVERVGPEDVSGKTLDEKEHASESGVSPHLVDFTIINPIGDPAGLRHEVMRMLLFAAARNGMQL